MSLEWHLSLPAKVQGTRKWTPIDSLPAKPANASTSSIPYNQPLYAVSTTYIFQISGYISRLPTNADFAAFCESPHSMRLAFCVPEDLFGNIIVFARVTSATFDTGRDVWMYHLACSTVLGKPEELDVDEHHVEKLKVEEVKVLQGKIEERKLELEKAGDLVKRLLDKGVGDKSGLISPKHRLQGAVPVSQRPRRTQDEKEDEGAREQFSFGFGKSVSKNI